MLYVDPSSAELDFTFYEEYIKNRPTVVVASLQEYCGAESPYTLSVKAPSKKGVTVSIEGFDLPTDTDFSSTFFKNTPVTLVCNLPKGTSFVRWEVNGEIVETETLTLANLTSDVTEVEVVLVVK